MKTYVITITETKDASIPHYLVDLSGDFNGRITPEELKWVVKALGISMRQFGAYLRTAPPVPKGAVTLRARIAGPQTPSCGKTL